jgi:hypothetical protein
MAKAPANNHRLGMVTKIPLPEWGNGKRMPGKELLQTDKNKLLG